MFVRLVLGWDAPEIEKVDEREDSPRTVIMASDPSFPNWALGLVIHLRRLDDCWFVAVIQPREGDVGLDFDFSERNGRPAVAVTWKGDGPQFVEIGYGGVSERKMIEPGDTAIFYVARPDAVGHYVTFPPEPSEFSQGYPLEPYRAGCSADMITGSCGDGS